MNRKLIGISAACALFAGTGAYQALADNVPLSQLPEPVQKAIKEHSQGENLEGVDRETRNGQTVYDAEFKREGLNRHVKFAADGTVLPEQGIGDRVIGRSNEAKSLKLSDLPAAVQKTVKEQQAGREVADIDQEMRDGKRVYDVEFKEKGANSHIYVASDGSMVVDKNSSSKSIGERVREAIGLDRGNDTITLDQAPAAVQKTVREHAEVGTLKPIKREVQNGRTQYDVEYEKDGKNMRMTVAEDGAILKDNR